MAWNRLRQLPRQRRHPIDGTYGNRAAVAFPAGPGDAPALSEIFARLGRGTGFTSPQATGRAWPGLGEAESVSFRLGAESLQVVFVPATGQPVTLDFRRYHPSLSERRFDDLFTCYPVASGSRLRFMAEPESHGASIAHLYVEGGGTLVQLLRAADGSLIVQWRRESVAISALLWGSHVQVHSVWWRFAPLDASRQPR